MKQSLRALYKQLKRDGLSPEQERIIKAELRFEGDHTFPEDLAAAAVDPAKALTETVPTFYGHHDPAVLQDLDRPGSNYTQNLQSLDELLERDKQREDDGFPRKIRVGKLIKPGKSGKDKVVIVPTTVEEKFMHDRVKPPEEGDSSGGTGEGEEGEVIGEQTVHEQGAGEGGAGQGEDGTHELESSAYDLGRILTKTFQLPNLKDKGKKRSLTRYTYDLTDRHRGFGQVLDKKATVKRVLQTNIVLGNVPDFNNIDPARFLIAPDDEVYRILSKEKDWESQAMVFFLRDYSGSMSGKPTELVVSQHVLIYSWLLFQYARQVETRFILHDTTAKEVPDFYTYYNLRVAGGTQVSSAYELVNDIVARENLARDYNIYVFHGTDGDDWDTEGKQAIPALTEMLRYSNRVGITVAAHGDGDGRKTEVERYLTASGLLKEKPELLRLDVMAEDSDEPRLIEGIKRLIS
ncbi:MAG: DUF444 family protein [Acidobacteria bacterium]|nr:DUF444 family protein [Acidobacteriota bacterium]